MADANEDGCDNRHFVRRPLRGVDDGTGRSVNEVVMSAGGMVNAVTPAPGKYGVPARRVVRLAEDDPTAQPGPS